MQTALLSGTPQRPLTGLARFLLLVTTATTIALFYAFISLALVLLLLWLGLLAIVVIAAARFGLSGYVVRLVEADFRLLGTVARALWLRPAPEYRLPLAREDAPRLFAMIDRLATRFAIPPPDEVCLEMTSGAWVDLRGLKTGLGRTRVGVGYDLLACLNEQEVEAVMAHELAHAKLIGRALHNWLRGGLNRAARVSNELSHVVDAHRRAKKSHASGAIMLRGAHALTRLCARQMAAYSRQGEFEADAGAARLCGAAPVRTSLQRLDAVQLKLARLPWSERVARIESPEGLSRWLIAELAPQNVAVEADSDTVRDPYSTHPPTCDRVAALPEDGSECIDTAPGLALLADADAVALKLVTAIEAKIARAEQEDLREIRKGLRRLRRQGSTRAAQWPGVLLFISAVVVGFASAISGEWIFGLILIAIGVPLGFWLHRLGRYRDRRKLSVPDFDHFMNARRDFPLPDVEAKQRELQAEIEATVVGETNVKRRAARLIDLAFAALAEGNYLRAHVTARLAETLDRTNVERHLAMMIAAAAFEQHDIASNLLAVSLQKTCWHSYSTEVAAAWTLMLGQDWTNAEALLHDALAAEPDQPNLRAMLAVCQAARGKTQSAIDNIRAALERNRSSVEARKLLVHELLNRGALREAADALAALGPASAYDPATVLLRMRLHLLRHEPSAAENELATLDLTTLPADKLLEIGFLYEFARIDGKAVEFFRRALERGHYPAAELALARHAMQAKDKTAARAHALAALDTTKTLGPKAASAYDVFQPALNLLLHLEEPAHTCRAWIANVLPGKDAGPLNDRALLVYAANEQEASTRLLDLLRALKPDAPALGTAYVDVTAAPSDLQPLHPVRPGVQSVYR